MDPRKFVQGTTRESVPLRFNQGYSSKINSQPTICGAHFPQNEYELKIDKLKTELELWRLKAEGYGAAKIEEEAKANQSERMLKEEKRINEQLSIRVGLLEKENAELKKNLSTQAEENDIKLSFTNQQLSATFSELTELRKKYEATRKQRVELQSQLNTLGGIKNELNQAKKTIEELKNKIIDKDAMCTTQTQKLLEVEKKQLEQFRQYSKILNEIGEML